MELLLFPVKEASEKFQKEKVHLCNSVFWCITCKFENEICWMSFPLDTNHNSILGLIFVTISVLLLQKFVEKSSAVPPSGKAGKHRVEQLQEDVMALRLRESQAVAELKEMKQRVMELETEVGRMSSATVTYIQMLHTMYFEKHTNCYKCICSFYAT